MLRWVLIPAGALLLAPLLVLPAAVAALGAAGSPPPSPHAHTDIPGDYLAWYAHWAAAECPGLPWVILAAIGKTESDHGRSRLPGVRSGTNSHGAAGPMQIGTGGAAGDTWAAYRTDGDIPPDGVADVYHPPDAIRAAASYLCAHGGADPDGLPDAILAYNPSRAYLQQVLAVAEGYQDQATAGQTTTPAGAPPPTADAAGLLANPDVTLSANAEADLRAGIIDPRVVTVLSALAERYPITVSVLKAGHSRYVAGTRRESHHFHGRAADISHLDGQPVSPRNPAAREAVAWLASLSGALRPDEVGSPFPEFEDQPGQFHDQAHLDHIHFGHREKSAT